MPSPDLVLNWATAVANEWRELAIVWHAALAVLAVSLLAGWRPSNRLLGILLTAPVVSVGIVAWTCANPFNGAVFSALAISLLAVAARGSKEPVRISGPGVAASGALLVLFGWVYPHFLRPTSWLDYAYAGPFGLLPCPTLAVVIGLTLTFSTLQSRPWGALTAAAGTFYGVIGVVSLDVALDFFLFGGAVVLWLNLVVPVSRSVRASPDESKQPFPGDELIESPVGTLNHGITIRVSRTDIWPWLAQMGAGSRAGWYSYDFLDNGRKRSARRIVPALQHLTVGMLFPALPGVTDAFTLLAYEPPRFLLLGVLSPDSEPVVTWAFVLNEVDARTTRLVVRVRAAAGRRIHGVPWTIAKYFIRAEHFVMQRKQLLGIAERAEAVAHAMPSMTAPGRAA